jgi:hypothetical protein
MSLWLFPGKNDVLNDDGYSNEVIKTLHWQHVIYLIWYNMSFFILFFYVFRLLKRCCRSYNYVTTRPDPCNINHNIMDTKVSGIIFWCLFVVIVWNSYYIIVETASYLICEIIQSRKYYPCGSKMCTAMVY